MKKSALLSITLVNWLLCAAHSAPLTTAFTYQGRLSDAGNPANGTYDFQFRLFDAPTNGGQVPIVLAYPTVAVSNGLFTTGLDFGSNVFNGTTWWLEISLRPSATFGQFTVLTPLQPLTPTPNALFSANAAQATTATTANGVVANAVSSMQLNTPSSPANGQVLSYNGASLVWTNASTVAAAWTLNGNAGTTPGVNFLGTTDNQPLELRVNNQRGLRLEPGGSNSVNVVSGWAGNSVAQDVVGGTVAGGGAGNYGNSPFFNRVEAHFGTVSGGAGNTIQADADHATIGGGNVNTIQANAGIGTIGGGQSNTIQSNAPLATISGGGGNTIQSDAWAATIGGGANNTIQTGAEYSTISGGNFNTVQTGGHSASATIGGGSFNTIQPFANFATIGGGFENTIQTGAWYTTIGGGHYNMIDSNIDSATITGGQNNAIESGSFNSTIGGGNNNRIRTNAFNSIIAGGINNTIQNAAQDTTVSGGANHTIGANAYFSTIAGGNGQLIEYNANNSTISGGSGNSIRADAADSTIGGGVGNVVDSNAVYSTINGGFNNAILSNAANSSIGGGGGNVVSNNAAFAVVPGGFSNTAGGANSLAAGHRAKALQNGAFVWADSTDTDFSSAATNEFAVRATGGVRFVSGVDSNGVPVAGVTLPAGSGSWSSLSDRDAKEHFKTANAREILERVAALPIQSWNYRSQNDSVRHIGPTAQDFHTAFGVGEDDRHIATVDEGGVALAAIQGLNQKIADELKRRDAENAELKQRLEKLEQLLNEKIGGER